MNDHTSEVMKKGVKQKVLAFCSLDKTEGATKSLHTVDTGEAFNFVTINTGCKSTDTSTLLLTTFIGS